MATIKVINFSKKKKLAKTLSIFFVVFTLIFCYMKFIVTPLLVNTAKSQVVVYANKAMNVAITEAMNQNITYEDLIHIVTDSSGKISMIQANSIQINSLSKLIGRVTMQTLNELVKTPIGIAIGAFTGIPIFAGIGPKVPINIYPYGDISCVFESKFISAGINQTQHKIYLKVSSAINVILPFNNMNVKTSSDVLLCESVIIGDIPDTYLKSNTLNEMLNLIP